VLHTRQKVGTSVGPVGTTPTPESESERSFVLRSFISLNTHNESPCESEYRTIRRAISRTIGRCGFRRKSAKQSMPVNFSSEQQRSCVADYRNLRTLYLVQPTKSGLPGILGRPEIPEPIFCADSESALGFLIG